MKIAWRELRRRPGRFTVAGVALTVIVVLVLFVAGLLDGLFLGSTGVIRAQQADVFVYSADARESFLRSRITPDIRAEVEATPGVEEVGGLGIALVGARVPGRDDLADTAVVGYELPADGVPAPPAPGTAYADERLRDAGVREGQTLLLGPAQVPVEVVGFVEDTSYLLQGALWVDGPTWREVQNKSRPDARVTDGVWQVLVASGAGSPTDLAAAIEQGTADATKVLTKDQAVLSLPGTQEQKATFNFIIYVTYLVAAIVVGLFFVLLTLERTALYGMLKAIGASSGQLIAGVILQAVIIAAAAVALGTAVAFLLSLPLPAGIPVQLVPSRAVQTGIAIVAVAVLGGLFSLRRILKIDPASAIGSAT